MPELAYERKVAGAVDDAVGRLTDALKQRGCGVLANLRLHDILAERTGAKIEPLVILEVCSPPHAERALAVDRNAALLLPCKVVVSRERGSTRIALQRPTAVLGAFLPEPGLTSLGDEVERTLREAIDQVAGKA